MIVDLTNARCVCFELEILTWLIDPFEQSTTSHFPYRNSGKRVDYLHMDQLSTAFVAPVPNMGAAFNANCPSLTSLRQRTTFRVAVPPSNVGSLRMQQTRSAPKRDKEKKRATPTFATDIKGNIVWTLRSGTPDDLDGIQDVTGEVLPRDLTESILSDSSCCTVCETSIKGTKEGQGFHSAIMGVVLVDLSIAYRDVKQGRESGLVKHGNLVTIAVDPEFPDAETDRKMLLGSLKKMKDSGVVDVIHFTSDSKRKALLEECGFKSLGRDELDTPKYMCDLVMSNPDPMKKML